MSTSSNVNYGVSALSAEYATAFPVVPRLSGIASFRFGKPVGDAAKTILRFVTKEKNASGTVATANDDFAAADAAADSAAVSYENGHRIISASLGPATDVDAAGLRKAAVAGVNKLRALKVKAAAVELPTVTGIPSTIVADVIVQASLLSNFAFDRYLTLESKKASLVGALTFVPSAAVGDSAAAEAEAAKIASVLANATIFARDLVNERSDGKRQRERRATVPSAPWGANPQGRFALTPPPPPTEMHPTRLEAVARQVALDADADIYVVTGAELLPLGLHLLHAVGQASRHAPRYIELTHEGDPANPDDVILLVGKGITFDSGGLNIKPTGSMEDMHMDMGGSAAVLGAFRALTQLGVKRNVVAVLAVAENAIDANAFKPHNILRSHKGLTVEIKNTDAEGRLVLADALSYAQQRVAPHTIIDLATLTGACIVGLGEYAAGMFTNNEALKGGLACASSARFERLWPMPIFDEHRDELKAAAMADLQSTGAGRYGGSCTAAAFIENFIGTTGKPTPAWAHLDIAGPAMYSKQRGHMNGGGTGFGAQVIAQYVLDAPKGALPADVKRKY